MLAENKGIIPFMARTSICHQPFGIQVVSKADMYYSAICDYASFIDLLRHHHAA
jgi:hypothetical protein